MLYMQPEMAQTSLCIRKLFEYSMTVKLLTEQYLEFLSLTGGCTSSPENATLLEITCRGSFARNVCVNRRV